MASSRAGKPPAGPLAGTVPAGRSQEWWHPLAGGRRAVSALVRPAQPGGVAPGQEPSLHGHDSQRLDVTFIVPSTCLGPSPSWEGSEGCKPQDKGFVSMQGQCPWDCWSRTVPKGRGDSTARSRAQDQHLPSAQCWQVPSAASISTY